MMNELPNDHQERYARHYALPEIGLTGQQRLQNSKVLCIGAGGLGSTALYYLAAAGVGTIGIVDSDSIELSNLQRQILYTTADVNQLKVDVAKAHLLALNPHVTLHTYPVRLTDENVFDIASDYDILVDATDNETTRYLISDACCIMKKPDVYAGILRFKGQYTVFCEENGPCYRCLYPASSPSAPLNCTQAGVLGVLPGLLGCLQATEVIKLIVQAGTSLSGRIMTFDALSHTWHEFALERNPNCPSCGTLDKPRHAEISTVPEISIQAFKTLSKEDYFLLDVREPEEYLEHNMGGHLIPLNDLPLRLHELNPTQNIIVHCKAGGRSREATLFLMQQGFTRVKNLQGGIMAWLQAQ